MKASRKGPKGAFRRPFGLILCGAVLMPTGIGYQDLAALIARQPAVSERWRAHVRNSTFGTIHAATFSFPRPTGAAMPDPYFTQLASLEPNALDSVGDLQPLLAPIEPRIAAPRYDYPEVDRRLKGDRLTVGGAPAEPVQDNPGKSSRKQDHAGLSEPQPPMSKGDRMSSPVQIAPVETAFTPFDSEAEQAPADAEAGPETAQQEASPDAAGDHIVESLAQFQVPGAQTERLFFGADEIGFGKGGLQQWQPEERPTVLTSRHVDADIKRSALVPSPDADADVSGESVAAKGEVTGEGKRPRTPAERLNLSGATRAKHERCLANAVYFEARGEVERGQMAVAQVVLNRAFSGYYPDNVCGVVYQNAHRHLACQFTFACDNVRDVVREPEAWARATRIARDALDGKFWLPEIGKATHYHATYVNPWWVRSMTKHSRLGIHIFYRPKRWGEGEEIPIWGERLEATGSVRPQAKAGADKSDAPRADAKAGTRRSIFDPVDEI